MIQKNVCQKMLNLIHISPNNLNIKPTMLGKHPSTSTYFRSKKKKQALTSYNTTKFRHIDITIHNMAQLTFLCIILF
ncbi:hypothetical protein LINPERHAP1_LOCUS25109 [Linum perenne]